MIDNTRGILTMSASVVVFIFNDALIKLAAETVPGVQAIGVRGVFATIWCALALLVSGTWRRMGGIAHPQVMLRGALDAPRRSSTWWRCSIFLSPSPPRSISRRR